MTGDRGWTKQCIALNFWIIKRISEGVLFFSNNPEMHRKNNFNWIVILCSHDRHFIPFYFLLFSYVVCRLKCKTCNRVLCWGINQFYVLNSVTLMEPHGGNSYESIFVTECSKNMHLKLDLHYSIMYQSFMNIISFACHL